ncbi:stress-induced protein [Pseudomonas sp. 250J]|uniref:General stress protein n=1 Tax=Pseudomonas peradeniyensis TaxID=2745488 RepID=A0ABT2VI13_9PSED|nr:MULTISPECIES: general stress protein [Pseudomonas]KNX77869.1 stress-induced protein [Pseudomonas sp. 250J]MCU7241355.1 general stress protein [Pseudomonas peradeniyensis]MCU7282524.1 general stress protein [Pseudomonas peradeniyensis]QZA56840.1 general stress protein [Pseudomonas sp. 2hn]
MARDPDQTDRRGGTKQTNPGNFANDRERASRAGQKGGRNSGGNFANDRARASEAGRKGGRNSHGGGSGS